MQLWTEPDRAVRIAQEREFVAASTDAELRRYAEANLAELEAGAPLHPLVWGARLVTIAFDGSRHLRLTGVPCGVIGVSCDLPEVGLFERRFAGVVVDTSAGGDHRVVIELAPQTMPESVALSGTLFVPPVWGAFRERLRIQPCEVPFLVDHEWIQVAGSALKPVKATPGLYRFDAGRLLPGRYELHMLAFCHAQFLELDATGATDIAIVIPSPVECTVRLVDDTSGEIVASGALSWGRDAIVPDDESEWRDWWPMTQNVVGDESASEFTFLAVQGAVLLSASADGYDDCEQEVTIAAGHNGFTLRMKRESGVRVRLVFVGEPTELSFGRPVVERLDGTRVICDARLQRCEWRLTGIEPGRYRVRLRDVPGFKPVAPIDVEVRQAELTDVAVEHLPDRVP